MVVITVFVIVFYGIGTLLACLLFVFSIHYEDQEKETWQDTHSKYIRFYWTLLYTLYNLHIILLWA